MKFEMAVSFEIAPMDTVLTSMGEVLANVTSVVGFSWAVLLQIRIITHS